MEQRLIGRKFEGRQNLCEKKPCPESCMDQHRAFTMPADAGLRRVIAFQNWPGIDITFLLPADPAKNLVDLIELGCDQVVIVIAARISRDSPCSGGLRPPNLFS